MTERPSTHAALSLAADGRWSGDRSDLERQLIEVEREARPTPVEPEHWRHDFDDEAQMRAYDSRRPTPVEPESPAYANVQPDETAGGGEPAGYDPQIDQWLAVEPDGLPLDVPRLARAIHDAMCTVSHHDGDGSGSPCFSKYPFIAESAARHYRLGAPSEDEQPR